jgi:carbonic anhydrase/acetyltransferase-like protein (isoleucine patch superfamily)
VAAGDVTIGPHNRVLFGAVITAEGGPVEIGRTCVVMENAVIRGVPGQETALATTYSLARALTSLAA